MSEEFKGHTTRLKSNGQKQADEIEEFINNFKHRLQPDQINYIKIQQSLHEKFRIIQFDANPISGYYVVFGGQRKDVLNAVFEISF